MSFDGIPIYQEKTYTRPPEIDGAPSERHPFIIVGSGPIGLALALDMAKKGHAITLVTAFDFIALGSKAICFSKQSLDIFDRLGVGDRMIERGVTWNVGKLFWKDQKDPVFQFDMLPVKNQKNPGFINLQQYYCEEYLLEALERMDNVDIRWGNKVTGIKQKEDYSVLAIETRDGSYELEAQYVLACDGSKSTIRGLLGLDFEGRVFEDNFLIADIKFSGPYAENRPSERWFWFDPPFCKGGTALLHKQPDDVWRCDFQLGWDVDREAAIQPENVDPFIRGMLGDDIAYKEEWYSVYTFQCRRMASFVHGPVIFVGDSAHLVSPFGARGANGGFSDAENVAWKLDLVLRGDAGRELLDSYDYERIMGADENILNSTRSTDFMTPKNEGSMAFRDAVLELSNEFEFARPFINSGRLSTPTPYHDSPLSTPDRDEWNTGPKPGHPCLDAPLEHNGHQQWLLSKLGDTFKVLHFGESSPHTDLETLICPSEGMAAERYGAVDGATYLVRPDQVVAARWKNASSADLDAALQKAMMQ
ncbi:MAG: FAD-dependent oxidoreductase [Henriciella sp.]